MVWACIGKRRILCEQESDVDGSVGEKKERKTEAEVVAKYLERVFDERTFYQYVILVSVMI